MGETTPGDIHRGVESDIRQALAQRIANADGYAHTRKAGGKDPSTVMTISKGELTVTITIQAAWKQEEPEFETK
jgi:hypothetical protein